MLVLLLAVVSLAGCRSVGMYDFGAGGNISKNESVDTAGAVFGFHGRNMFNSVIGIDYTADITSAFAIDAKGGAGGEQVALVGARNGLGMGTSVGPAFRLFGAGDWFALMASPVFRMSFLGFNEEKEKMPQLNMLGAGVGLNLSSDFYLGSSFYMRVGFDLGVEWSKLEYLDNEFMIHDSVYKDAGIGARFVMYPRIGIGWRTGGPKDTGKSGVKSRYRLPPGTNTLTYGEWLVGNYVDEFDVPTGEKHIFLLAEHYAKGHQQQPLSLERITISSLSDRKPEPVIRIDSKDTMIRLAKSVWLSYRVIGGDMDGLRVQDFYVPDEEIYAYSGSYTISIGERKSDRERFLHTMMDALATGSDVELSIRTNEGYSSNYILPGEGFGWAASQLFDVSSP